MSNIEEPSIVDVVQPAGAEPQKIGAAQKAKMKVGRYVKSGAGRIAIGMVIVMGLYMVYHHLAPNKNAVTASAVLAPPPGINTGAGGRVQRTNPDVAASLAADERRRQSEALATDRDYVPTQVTSVKTVDMGHAAGDHEAGPPPPPQPPVMTQSEEPSRIATASQISAMTPDQQNQQQTQRAQSMQNYLRGLQSANLGSRGVAMAGHLELAQSYSKRLTQDGAPAGGGFQTAAQSVGVSSTGASSAGIDAKPLIVYARLGDKLLGRTSMSVSSLSPTDILVDVISGDLGDPTDHATLVCGPTKTDEGFVFRCHTMELPRSMGGRSVSISAMLIDPETTETAISSSIYRGYFERYVLDVGAAFLQAFGQSAGQAQTSTSINAGATSINVSPLTLRQELFAAAGGGAGKLGQGIDAMVNSGRYPIITLDKGVPVGIVMMADATNASTGGNAGGGGAAGATVAPAAGSAPSAGAAALGGLLAPAAASSLSIAGHAAQSDAQAIAGQAGAHLSSGN